MAGRPPGGRQAEPRRDRQGDTLVITEIDRLGDSVHKLVGLATLLRERGIDLRVLEQAGGKVTFHILGAIAEFERDLISERTHDGEAICVSPCPHPKNRVWHQIWCEAASTGVASGAS